MSVGDRLRLRNTILRKRARGRKLTKREKHALALIDAEILARLPVVNEADLWTELDRHFSTANGNPV